MIGLRTPLGVSLLLVSLLASPLRAGSREVKTLESAAGVVQGLSVIPWGLLHDAAGVAIFPHAVKAALVVDERFGRGVVLVHEPDGRWSNPLFVTLTGAGIGGQAGIESTDLVLIFKTRKSLDRVLQGKLTLGEEVTIAAGPIGRDAELATQGRLQADIFSYSRSRGLFAGVSLERAKVHMDARSSKAFYGLREGSPAEVLNHRGATIAAVENLKARLLGLRTPPNAQPVITPVPPPPPPPWRR
jgi:lipid-binding SYLF domain-containing protein